jgi:hypothetical protein
MVQQTHLNITPDLWVGARGATIDLSEILG